MENNNGRGIFYGVIGVATLVVAIIGATFAYFSASVTAEGNVTAGTANIELTMVEDITGLKQKLIPIDTDAAGAGAEGNKDTVNYLDAFKVVPVNDANRCQDDLGNEICSVYKFTIQNNNSTTQTVTGYMNVNTDSTVATDLPNLYYAVFAGNAHTSYDVHAETLGAASTLTCTNGTEGALSECTGSQVVHTATLASTLPKAGALSEDLAAGWKKIDGSQIELGPYESVSFEVVLWLEETYSKQEEQAKTFAANIHFTTGSGQGVTGQLTVGA